MAQEVFKSPLDQMEELMALNRENRRNTLNKRINYKGNYENDITGGSRALNNQAQIWDKNNIANTMTIADPNGVGADWTLEPIKKDIEGLNDRYEGRNGKNINYTPSTKRGRRLADIYHQKILSKDPRFLAQAMEPFEDNEATRIWNKIKEYEGVK